MLRLLSMIGSTVFWRFALAAGLLVVALCEVPLATVPERLLFERLCRLRPAPPAVGLEVLAIDAPSLRQVGPWPWPRTRVAEGVQAAADAGARSVGLQLLYPVREWNPGLTGIRALRDEIPPTGETAALRLAFDDLAMQIDGDRQLQAAAAAVTVVIPWRPAAEAAPADTRLLAAALPPLSADDTPGQRFAALRNPLSAQRPPVVTGIEQNYPEFAAAAAGRGGLWPLAVDGSMPLLAADAGSGRLFPGFALQLARARSGHQLAELRLQDGHLLLDGREVVAGEGFRVEINPARRASLPVRSFVDLVNGRLPEGALQGKTVLIGLLDPETDTGLLTTAAVAADLMSGSTIHRPHWAFLLEAGVVLYLGIFLVLVVPRLSARLGLFLLLFFLASWLGVATALLVSQGLWLHLSPAILLAAGGAVLTLLTARERRPVAGYEDVKLLGLSLQGQGMLDMAHEKFLQCPVRDTSVRELLYNLALDFERKRMFNKAESVYRHILTAGRFKDVKTRLANLHQVEQTQVLGAGRGGTMVLGGNGARPTLGRYEVLRELGQGAMGTVYLGRDPKINREVAIKTLNLQQIEPQQVGEIKARFFREAEAAGRLNHPHIVTIYDAGEEHDLAYLAMEFLPGKTLSAHCVRDKLLPPKEVLRIAADIAAALAYAHAHDIIHRDIKPANIMLLPDGKVKVTDFGIARVVSASHTQTGVVLGTPSYMSPEQVAGKKVDGRSDLFSLGVLCYEMLCGEKPFSGDSLGALMYSISNADYPPLAKKVPKKLPACCLDIVDKLLAKGVSRRYKNATEAEQALRSCSAKM